jgi:GMP synthase-like glutamine amidotransferase
MQLPYRVLIVGGGYDYVRYFYEQCYSGARTPEEADIIVFTGGEDVDPKWYGETSLQHTFSNVERDRREKVIFDYAVEKGIPMVGICRGGQFLNVMNSGKMWQHVTGHGGNHAIVEVLDKRIKREPRIFNVTSTHHQMMIPAKSAIVLAVGITDNGESICKSRASYGEVVEGSDPKKYPDYEVLWYPKTQSLCFQPHPEFPQAPKDCKEYFEELMENWVVPLA